MKKWLLAVLLPPLLSACSNSEEEARTLLNHAIQDWDRGELALALQAFDRIEDQYLHTAAATDALTERAARIEGYRLEFGPEANQRRNRGWCRVMFFSTLKRCTSAADFTRPG